MVQHVESGRKVFKKGISTEAATEGNVKEAKGRMLEEVEGDGKKPLDFATWRRFFNLGKSNFSGRKTQV